MANDEWEFLGDVPNDLSNVESINNVSDDIEFDLESVDDTPIGDGICVVCGAPTFRPPGLTRGGNRKRVPKFCEEHDPKATSTTTTNSSSHTRTSTGITDKALQNIQEELADDLKLLGTLAGALYPVTGLYLVENADPFTIALVKLAGKNQRLLRVLHRAAQVAPVYTVAETIAGAAIAVQVDSGKVDPHGIVAKRVGVERIYNELHPDEQQFNQSPFQQPPHFATVR